MVTVITNMMMTIMITVVVTCSAGYQLPARVFFFAALYALRRNVSQFRSLPEKRSAVTDV